MGAVSGTVYDSSGSPAQNRIVRAYRRTDGSLIGEAYSGDGSQDTNFSSVSLLLMGNGRIGTQSVVDSAPTPKTVTVIGDVRLSDEQVKFGGASLKFDGTGDMLRLAYDNVFNLPGDFTVEMWVYFDTLADAHLINYAGGNGIAWASWEVVFDGTDIRFAGSSSNSGYDIGSESGASSLIGTPTVDTWHHIAVTRSGNTWRGFLDGVQGFSLTSSSSPYSQTDRGVTIGGFYNAYPWGSGATAAHLNGFLDSMRVTKGAARYTAAFTPPARPFALNGSVATAGTYSIDCGSFSGEVQVICLDDSGGTLENDLILRTYPV